MTSLAMRARILAFTCSLMCVATAAVAETARYEIDPEHTTIGFSALAFDDAYTVTPHLTLNIPTTGVQGGGTAANDILGAGAVTGFGFAPACTGTAAGAQLDAGAANGRLTLNANGGYTWSGPQPATGTTPVTFSVASRDPFGLQ